MTDILEKLTHIIREAFNNKDVVAVPSLTADQVKGWDSLSFIRLLVAIEEAFGIEFGANEVSTLKNVGELAELIQRKISA